MARRVPRTPEALLEKALLAETPVLRAKYATRGLSHPTVEQDTQLLLLRQLYVAHLEREQFEEARAVAEQMVSLGELEEPSRHDAARACLALGDFAAAIHHFRMAARRAPAQRRALHLWNLGRAAYLAGRHAEAAAAFKRAQRWAVDNQALYRVHAALARHHLGEPIDLRATYETLGAIQPLPTYAEFLGAELLRLLGERALSASLLRQFLLQVPSAPVEMAVGLRAEVRRAQEWLAELERAATERTPTEPERSNRG